jgi:tetratricopeptide (TPR) repeat protein
VTVQAAPAADDVRPSPEQTAGASVARRGSRKRWWRWLVVGGLLACFLGATARVWPWARGTQYLNAARQALDRGDPVGALVPLQAAEQFQPRRAEVQYLLAVAQRRTGHLDRFPAHLQRAQTLGWPAPDLERQELLAVAQAGDVEAVRSRLQEWIDHGTTDDVAEEIYEALARGYLTTYRLQDAWKCLDSWLSWRPDAPQARLMRGYVHEQLDQVALAIEDYRAAVAALPHDPEANLKLADLLLRQGSLDEAEAHYRVVVEADAASVEALIGLARCDHSRGQHDSARRQLETALTLQPSVKQQSDALGDLGRILLKEGKNPEALETLRRATRLAPAEIAIHRALATAYTRVGDAVQAKFHADRAREIDAQYDRVGDIQRALVEKPNDADLRCEAGKILMEQGLASKGLGWLLTALKCDRYHRPTHRLLADYYAAVGQQSLAAQHRLLAARAPDKHPAAKPQGVREEEGPQGP